MILVDTSIWIDHFRGTSSTLSELLQRDLVYTHTWVIGELACGNLGKRAEILALLQALPQLAPATANEALFFIERHRLMGRGIGYIDVHLLAAAAIHSSRLYTRDKRLHGIAEELGLAYPLTIH